MFRSSTSRRKRNFAAFFILFFSFAFSASASSHIARFVFVTEPRTVAAGAISEEITIQAQDASGNAVAPNETVDLKFSSSASTGEFLNAAGNPVSTVMNSNWKNRTFYYRDTASGVFTIKVNATGRVSGNTWEATQTITVVRAQSPPPSPPEGNAAQEKVATAPIVSVDAGEDRKAAPNEVLEFRGIIKTADGKPLMNARFFWDFGDSERAEEISTAHAFRGPGQYRVGFHVISGNTAVSDYVTVTVTKNPEIAVNPPPAPNVTISAQETQKAVPQNGDRAAHQSVRASPSPENTKAEIAAVAAATAEPQSRLLPPMLMAAALSAFAAIGFLLIRIFSL